MAGREVTRGRRTGGRGLGQSLEQLLGGPGSRQGSKSAGSQAFIAERMVKDLCFQREISIRGGSVYYATWLHIKFEEDRLGERL